MPRWSDDYPRKKAHPLHDTWCAMIKRCHDPKFRHYKNYGARGISVCEGWRNSFWQFVKDVGPRPSDDHSLDRIDNNGNYKPSNVRWATHPEQCRNTRFNRRLTANGKTQTLAEWVLETGLPKSTLFNRIRRGWSDEEVINTPAQPKSANGSILPPNGHAICEARGIHPWTVASRIRRGWTFEEAISRPVAKQKGGHRVQPKA